MPAAAKKTAKQAEKKAEGQQTKPRKYTGDKWELKISTAEVKAAVEAKPAIRGVHITAWVAGSEPLRKKIISNIKGTVLNTVVIALKEMDGAVYIKGVEKAEKYKAYTSAIANPEKMVEDFKREGLYTVGRIVLFKDDVLPVKRPDLAVKTPEGNIWRDRKGKTWADQYSKEVWDYNIAVALRAVEAGFDEIQFDYIRYPSEGKVSLCRYSVPHNWDKARANLAEFLRYARERIPEQIRISADVFGLTTSARDDMGIGQNLPLIAQYADYVYPMMYPSHYYPGHYGLRNPNSEPYKVINFGLRDAMARLELNYAKLRPYLQDFSKYGPHEVGEQIRALRKNYLHSWVMWSPNNKYSWEAYKPEYYKKYIDPDYEP
ncbi:MAG: putative glycoside hydrolase [Elusimicrobiales bacterium]|nr:putative glycoside hydrolase [Elusimicrobiales bacterium]